MHKILFILIVSILCGTGFAGDVKVKSYIKKDGTVVDSYSRSRPNAYKWDNKSYTPSQEPYNKSYSQPTKNYNSDWKKPSETRLNDSNPYNDSAPAYQPAAIRTTPIYEAPKTKTYTNPYSMPKIKTYEAPAENNDTNPYSMPKVNPYAAPKTNTYTNPYALPKTKTYEVPKENSYSNPYATPKTNTYTNPYAPKNNLGFDDEESSDSDE